MKADKLRSKFLKFFSDNGHRVVPSAPAVPSDDPTLLFVNAGMNPFKTLFEGGSHSDPLVSVQKCIRAGGKHNDLKNVGHTSRHMTFFEMMGNFSFGSYCRSEAIDYAWKVSTEIFELDPDRIWISVFESDDSAYDLWSSYVGSKRVVRLGSDDNFWSMGACGPCGPSSEMLYDKGGKFGGGDSPLKDSGERYLEYWNLVFMESNRTSTGEVEPLPSLCIDTGAGLERVLSLIDGTVTVFQTDPFRAIITALEDLFGVEYPNVSCFCSLDKFFDHAAPFHVVADHLRTLAVAIADGARPGNVERGYVLRKILRRAVNYGRRAGVRFPFMGNLVPVVVEMMGGTYPELCESVNVISEILNDEEEQFLSTLSNSGALLTKAITVAKKDCSGVLSGDMAFKLKDTYGCPIEEIELMAHDEGISLDMEGYLRCERKARELSVSSSNRRVKMPMDIEHCECSNSEFIRDFTGVGVVVGIFSDDGWVESCGCGQDLVVVLNRTTFYAERGGQVSDSGTLRSDEGVFKVCDVQHGPAGTVLHIGTMLSGVITVGNSVSCNIAFDKRMDISRNHTAVHLLHYALSEKFGSGVKQAGSRVDCSDARFDFTFHRPISSDEKRELQRFVNDMVRSDLLVDSYEMPFDVVSRDPRIKCLFEEKYGEVVRVVDIGGASKELCGGTHVKRLGEIGMVRIMKIFGISKGVLRVEFISGDSVDSYVDHLESDADNIISITKRPDVFQSFLSLMEERDCLTQKLVKVRRQWFGLLSDGFSTKIRDTNGVEYICEEVAFVGNELEEFSALLLSRFHNTILLFYAENVNGCVVYLSIPRPLVKGLINAGKLMSQLSVGLGISGGGGPTIARGGGRSKVGVVMVRDVFEKILKGCS